MAFNWSSEVPGTPGPDLLTAGWPVGAGSDRLPGWSADSVHLANWSLAAARLGPPPTEHPATELETRLSLTYTLCEILVGIVAAVGNSLVCIVFVTDRRLRKQTNYYILSLALSDLLVGVLGVPVAVLASVGLPRALGACLVSISVLLILCTTSILNLLAVSVDRFWAILYPMQYARIMTSQLVTGIIIGCWVLGAVVGLLPVMGWNAGPYPSCLFTRVMDYDYLVFLYFATIVFPGLVMAVFYIRIYIVVVKQVRSMSFFSHLPESARESSCYRNCAGGQVARKEVKAAKNLSIIVLFFMVCWFPLYTINCINAFCPDCNIPLQLTNFTIILSHANSALNPLLYAYNLKDFRRAMYSLVCVRLLGCTAAEPADWLRAKIVAEQEALRLHRQRAGRTRTQSAPLPRPVELLQPPPAGYDRQLPLNPALLTARPAGRPPTLATSEHTDRRVAAPPLGREAALLSAPAVPRRRARSAGEVARPARSYRWPLDQGSMRQRPRSRLRFKSSDS
ncbi:adenosine receptor A2b-like [Amphibalanus amphitrite]|uniref:adenosine receptor A2b-like n=1 Tax=Amphibalanus amphitrite TaxID=1232801 RepID=UPI001C91D6E0|nr:adenosine receptor A2b-like [Amphibalanus amphitrite]